MHTVSWKGGRFGWAAAPGTTWRLLAVRLGYRAVVLLGFALTSGVHPGIRPDVYPAILDAARFALGVGAPARGPVHWRGWQLRPRGSGGVNYSASPWARRLPGRCSARSLDAARIWGIITESASA